jgi:hypothetical protein
MLHKAFDILWHMIMGVLATLGEIFAIFKVANFLRGISHGLPIPLAPVTNV